MGDGAILEGDQGAPGNPGNANITIVVRYSMKVPLTDAESGVEQSILSTLNMFRYDFSKGTRYQTPCKPIQNSSNCQCFKVI